MGVRAWRNKNKRQQVKQQQHSPTERWRRWRQLHAYITSESPQFVCPRINHVKNSYKEHSCMSVTSIVVSRSMYNTTLFQPTEPVDAVFRWSNHNRKDKTKTYWPTICLDELGIKVICKQWLRKVPEVELKKSCHGMDVRLGHLHQSTLTVWGMDIKRDLSKPCTREWGHNMIRAREKGLTG